MLSALNNQYKVIERALCTYNIIKYRLRKYVHMEKEIVLRVRKLPKGAKIAVYPMSTAYGDIFTAYATLCYGTEGMPIELSEPFRGVLEDFDGTYVYMRTDKYYCLKVDINELKNVVQMV